MRNRGWRGDPPADDVEARERIIAAAMRCIDRHGPNMAGSQFFVFCVALAAMLALFATLYNVELAGKRLDARLRELRELLA